MRLRQEEIVAIADFLKMPVVDFTEKYTDLSAERDGLIMKCHPDGRCFFLGDDNLCTIQSVKPRQCRSFPYDWQPTPEQAKLCQGHWEEEW